MLLDAGISQNQQKSLRTSQNNLELTKRLSNSIHSYSRLFIRHFLSTMLTLNSFTIADKLVVDTNPLLVEHDNFFS